MSFRSALGLLAIVWLAGCTPASDDERARKAHAPIYYTGGNHDLLCVGLHWGEPNENQGAGTDSQYAAEVFYRLKAGKRGQVTADLQYVEDPAASTQSSIWIVGLRGRLAF